MKVDIGIIGAMEEEVSLLVSSLADTVCESVSGMRFYVGTLHGKRVAVVKCGIGKVFAAIACEAMAIKYSPSLIINTGVGGAIADGLTTGDIVVADKLVQHDMDTSPIGDPKGLISGINKIYFDADTRAVALAKRLADSMGINARVGTIASGDVFVASKELKNKISSEFSASVCEMEGGAIAHAAYVNSIPCCVIRAISDSADGKATVDYPTFVKSSSLVSARLTSMLVKEY